MSALLLVKGSVRYIILGIVLGAVLTGCETSVPHVPTEGTFVGQRIDTTVDSDIARYYLEHYLYGNEADIKMHAQIDDMQERLQKDGVNRDTLAHIANSVSPDLATLMFVSHLANQPSNIRMQSTFGEEIETIEGDEEQEWSDTAYNDSPLESYLILFAPGWLYRTDPETGADFRQQRAIFERMGVRTALIETEESGSVERNATIITNEIMRRRKSEDNIILVSTSKSGAEVALAIGMSLTPEQTEHVRAWVNIGGVIQGTPLADGAMRWPQRWGVRLYFWWKGWDIAGLASMTTDVRRARYTAVHIPQDILVLNYMAVPLSGDLSEGVRSRYDALRSSGPNDGLTLLVDEILPESVTVIEIGLDHLFDDPDIEQKTVALFRTVVRSLLRNPSHKNRTHTPINHIQ